MSYLETPKFVSKDNNLSTLKINNQEQQKLLEGELNFNIQTRIARKTGDKRLCDC